MNKAEAAAYLEVSTRAIERYTAKGKLTPKYEKGRTGLAPVYDPDQLDALKQEMNDSTVAQGSPLKHDKPAKADKRDTSDSTNNSKMLAKRAGKLPELAQFVSALEVARAMQPSLTDLAAKPLLTRSEAQRLTGLSRDVLKGFVESGKLKERLIGRAYRIKRDDLDKFVRGL